MLEKSKRKNNNSYKTLKHFDNIFNTDTRHTIKQMPLYNEFYERFVDDFYTPDEDTKVLMKRRRIISDELEKTFTKAQQDLFEKYWDLDCQIDEDLRKQIFLFGYITAIELFIETTNNK